MFPKYKKQEKLTSLKQNYQLYQILTFYHIKFRIVLNLIIKDNVKASYVYPPLFHSVPLPSGVNDAL